MLDFVVVVVKQKKAQAFLARMATFFLQQQPQEQLHVQEMLGEPTKIFLDLTHSFCAHHDTSRNVV